MRGPGQVWGQGHPEKFEGSNLLCVVATYCQKEHHKAVSESKHHFLGLRGVGAHIVGGSPLFSIRGSSLQYGGGGILGGTAGAGIIYVDSALNGIGRAEVTEADNECEGTKQRALGGPSVYGDEGGHNMAHLNALLTFQRKSAAPSDQTVGGTCLLEFPQQNVVIHHIACFGIIQQDGADMMSRFVQRCMDIMC